MAKNIFEVVVFSTAMVLIYVFIMGGCALSDRCSESVGVYHDR